jgi:protein TonB
MACNARCMRLQSLPPAEATVPATASAPGEAMLVDVVVLSADQELFQSAREAVGERNPVWRARSADEAADLLITGRCGVLVLDMAALSTRGDTLIEQIVQQFPDVVVCVAGTRADEPMLAPLISSGLVYRFMHKPTSPRRAGMFLQAAIRRYAERLAGNAGSDPLLPLLRGLQRPTAGMPRGYLALIGLLALGFGASLFVGDTPREAVTAMAIATPAVAPALAPPTPRADPVLSRARAALQAGRLESPEGRNALDLFQAVLLAQPEHAEALESLGRTIDLLLQRAHEEADAGRKAEAERLVGRVLEAMPEHPQALALVRRLNPPDTPSQQLSREQLAEVEQSVAGAAPAVATAPAPTRPRTLEEIEAELARLPGPVTSLAAAAPVVETTAATGAAPVVRPDPLAPVVRNASRATQPVPRSYAREVAALPIAGTARPVAREAAAKPAAAPDMAHAMAPGIVAADAMDRVAAKDPVYPTQALREGTRGWVELEFTITASGTVRDIEVVGAEPQGVFDAAASAAVADWRYKPRVVNGQPVAQRSRVTLRFDVDG